MSSPNYNDYEQLLQRDDLEGVYLGTEPPRHLEVISAAGGRGNTSSATSLSP